jgi:hypothetical protein
MSLWRRHRAFYYRISGALPCEITIEKYPMATRAKAFRLKSMKGECSMFIFNRILMWTGQLAGAGAITLGLLHWFFRISFINIHMLFGVLVTLSLLIAGSIAVFTKGQRVLGAVAIVFALIVPVFGRTQMLILVGDFHWLIQVAHLLVGATAVTLIERLCKQYMQIKQKPVAGKEAIQVS